jgi:transposase InsO family protein
MIGQTELSIRKSCPTLQVGRSSYYKWKNNGFVTYLNLHLRNEIQSIALEFPFYGYRRITKELHRRGLIINSKKVRKIMKEDNLLCLRKKAFRPVTTQSDHDCRIYPNLSKDLKVTGLNQLWVADITYIRLPHEFIYLAAILDAFSKKCIGWSLGRYINTILTLKALSMALTKRKKIGFTNLMHHSDRGVQYAAEEYIELLKRFGIKISMSRSGNPYDNASMESFMKTLKVEEVYINEYETFEEALKNLKHFIDLVYNDKRLHSSIDYVPPNEFEMEVLKTSKY